MKYKYFCWLCNKSASSAESIDHKCPSYTIEKIEESTLMNKLLKSFWKLDFEFLILLVSSITINCLILHHLDWSFKEKIIESLSLGFILARFKR